MLPSNLIQVYHNLFVNRLDVCYEQWITGSNWGYSKLVTPVTIDLIALHLQGEKTLAFPTFNQDGFCKWACFDFDDTAGSLQTVQGALLSFGLMALHEGSRPGREGHLWILFDNPVSASDLIMLKQHVLKRAGIKSGDIEFFPKQDKATIGNPVRGPLGIHLKPEANGERGWFDGVEQDLEIQLEWLANQPSNSATAFNNLVGVWSKYRFEPIITRKYKADSFNIWDYDIDVRKHGKEWITQCPVCAAEGHDENKDNLHILENGSFICMYNQPGKTHQRKEIIRLLSNED